MALLVHAWLLLVLQLWKDIELLLILFCVLYELKYCILWEPLSFDQPLAVKLHLSLQTSLPGRSQVEQTLPNLTCTLRRPDVVEVYGSITGLLCV